MVHEYSCIFSLSQPDETWRSISSSLTMSIMTSSIASFSVFTRSGFGGPIDLSFSESTDPSPGWTSEQQGLGWRSCKFLPTGFHSRCCFRHKTLSEHLKAKKKKKLRIWIFKIHENCICCKLGHLMQVFCFVSNTIWIPLMKNHLWLLFSLSVRAY